MGIFGNAALFLSRARARKRRTSGGRHGIAIQAVRVIMATAIAFLLSGIIAEPFSTSTSALFSAPEKRDFRMTDLFAQIADQRPVRILDDRIVIVDIGRAGRDEIAEGLSLLSLCGPKAIGVDVNFADTTGNDSAILEAIAANPGIVLPLGLAEKDNGRFIADETPFFYGMDGLDVNYGAINLPSTDTKATIREYAVGFRTDNGTVPSFVAALARLSSPEAAGKLHERGENLGVTAYHSRDFRTVKLAEIEQNAEQFADKTVLLGSLDDASDMHATPINSYMPGVLLHAYALATVLDGTWYEKTSALFDYMAAILVCLIISAISLTAKGRYRGIILRILQVTCVFLAVRIGYETFIDHNILFNFTYTMLMVAFALFAVDIWNGLEETGHLIHKKIKQRTDSLTCENSY